MTISYQFELPMGHRLKAHNGKCRNLHGHNYVIKVVLRGDVDEQTGMVMDFHDLKTAVHDVFDKYDHAFVLELSDNFLREVNHDETPILYIEVPPTAENLAKIWQAELQQRLQTPKVNLNVWETEFCSVSV